MALPLFPAISFVTDYANAGGRDERMISGEIASVTTNLSASDPATLFNGVISETVFKFAAHTSGGIVIQFPEPKFIDEITWYQDQAASQGPFVLQGSNDGTLWSDVAAGLLFGVTSISKVTVLPLSTTPYMYFQLVLDGGGSTTAVPFIHEIEFKICSGNSGIIVPGVDFKSQNSVSFAINENQFGDGYSQRSAQGINNARDSWSASWTNITTREKDTIVKFIRAMKGYQAFHWVAPGDDAPSQWTARDLKINPIDAGKWGVTSTFRMEFDL
jgi:phage-related protein